MPTSAGRIAQQRASACRDQRNDVSNGAWSGMCLNQHDPNMLPEVGSQKSGINKTTRHGRPGGTQWSRVGHAAMTILAFRFLLQTSASRSRGQVGIKILQCLADVFVLLEHVVRSDA